MTKLPFTEDDAWLVASAAENLRSAPSDDKERERRVEAAWRIAPKLDDLMRRMLAALKENEEVE
ncbi:hypothetical protein [Rhizobium leguminosarum]|uniref:hypothetical protein n=1 Tax=Rhizobium leguminosarum TaxID=384 RepID=UPI0013BC8070|nr:hypothetical protein [Rhizobium leguminosarum]NEI60890.1 hypothetical protein [Rhizobium leguminosarum]